ncbi:MAG: PIN domain-containing protein [Oscillospiraceae bacterium]
MDNSVYLIDYENVSYKGLYGIGNLQPNDEIIIFYSQDINIIKDIISIYEQSGVIIKYFELDETGKNALDFMVSAYAGYIASNPNIKRIAVISKDKGYTSIIPVIKAVNNEIEMIFDSCIYNIINPETKTQIVSVDTEQFLEEETEDIEQTDSSIPIKINKKPPIKIKSSMTNSQKKQLKKYIENIISKNIPKNYVAGVSDFILKSLCSNMTTNQIRSGLYKIFGSNTKNNKYCSRVKSYYEEFRNMKLKGEL